METGRGLATPRDIRDLCDLYEVTDEAERDRMMDLAKESKQQGWWHGLRSALTPPMSALRQAAVLDQDYHSAIVPGLLQTADYARAMHESSMTQARPEPD